MLNQSLSALMDGETDTREAAALLERIRHDPELRLTWARQHYLRICICERPPLEIKGEFADRVMSRIAAAEAELGSKTAKRRPLSYRPGGIRHAIRRRGWRRPVAGIAVAASVAAAILVLEQGPVTTPGGVSATTAAITADAPHAERIARSEAADQTATESAAAMVSEQHAPSTEPAVQEVAQTTTDQDGHVADTASGTEATTVAVSAESKAMKPVVLKNQSESSKPDSSSVSGTQLEQLIGTDSSPLGWDAASLSRDRQLRNLMFSHESTRIESSGVSKRLGYISQAPQDGATASATTTAAATSGESASQ